MRVRLATLPLALLLAACASGTAPAPTPAPNPAPAPISDAPPPAPEPATEPAMTSAPDAWQLLDLDADRVPGVSAARAYSELLGGRSPERTVVVAIIDSGIDTAHVDLRDVLWSNEDEAAGNGVDDDGNGYVDDVRGWNFIGGADGQNVDHETYEVTRLLATCQAGEPLPAGLHPQDATCESISEAYGQQQGEAEQTLVAIGQIEENLSIVLPILRQQLGGEEPTPENVAGIVSPSNQIMQARAYFLQTAEAGLSPGG